MNRVGIVSYNLHYNYSNFGSILQTYALQEALKRECNVEPVIIDYCPELFKNCDPVNPLRNIQDKGSDFYKTCEILLNDIKDNEAKIRKFVSDKYNCSKRTYFPQNFKKSLKDEGLKGYVCGSDAIWSYEYFKTFDDAFYGNYRCMKKSHTISYAASFGETVFSDEQRKVMLKRMKNFKAIGVRESTEIDKISDCVDVPVKRVLDPTFLLSVDDYKHLMTPREINKPYILIYSRRFDPRLYETAEIVSQELGLQIVEISLDIRHADKNIQKYSAGVEEFLSLVYYSDFVLTNSLHGTIFSIIMNKDFYVYPRIHGEIKIMELLNLLNSAERRLDKPIKTHSIISIDYGMINAILAREIDSSKCFLYDSLKSIAI